MIGHVMMFICWLRNSPPVMQVEKIRWHRTIGSMTAGDEVLDHSQTVVFNVFTTHYCHIYGILFTLRHEIVCQSLQMGAERGSLHM